MNLYEKMNDGVYIIAEMSANHGGSLESAFRIIEEVKRAGADCLKIQTYTADTLTIDCKKEHFVVKGGLWDGYNYYDLYREAYTPWEWQGRIKNKCDEVGIDFLSTPFDHTAVDFLEGLGIEFYKIASYELVDIPLIEYVAKKGKPLIMSCGMASVEEIEEAINACKKHGNDQIVLLKCCSEYPADFSDMNLATIPDMQKRFQLPIGLSDHSMGSLAPVVAVSLGATLIEKHVRLDGDTSSADSAFSMEMTDFNKMVEDVRNAYRIKGNATYELTKKEKEGLKIRRSLFAVKDIKYGEAFTTENVRSIRPGYGIKPKYLSLLLQQKARRDYSYGDPINEEELN
jgi:N-acetylneuraminate synthase/pseudaminic acid synthase